MKRHSFFSGGLASIGLASTLFVAGAAVVPSSAWAEGNAAEDPDGARTLMKEAVAARDAKNFPECVSKATAAWAKFHHAQVAGLLGLCEVEVGQYADGANHLAFYLKDASSVTPESKAEADAALAKAKTHLAEVTLACEPGDVELSIDGKVVGSAPLTIFIEPGEHTIEAKKDGFEPKAQKQNAVASTTIEVRIVLDREGTHGGKRAVWPWFLGGGIAVVGVVVGATLQGVAAGKVSNADDAVKQAGGRCPENPTSDPCKAGKSANDSANSLKVGSYVSFGVAGAGLALGAILYAALPPKHRPKDAALVPLAGPGFGGFQFSTRF